MCFNPRARDGREKDIADYAIKFRVSIHAPVMDANDWFVLLNIFDLFQSTRP